MTPSISLDSTLRLRRLSRQLEDGVALIGYGGQFLELPPEGLHFVAWLNEGLTLAEARHRFEQKYNPFPDDELMAVMEAFVDCDFVAKVDDEFIPPKKTIAAGPSFSQPRPWAKAMFSAPLLLAWMLFASLAMVVWISTPTLWPRLSHYFWTDYNFLLVLSSMLIWLIMVGFHEFFHWAACQAKGMHATITWTKRLIFFPTSQTVMHDIWSFPKKSRYLPLAAGLIFDILCLSIAILVLASAHYGLVALSDLVTQLLQFFVLLTTLGITGQFWLFGKFDGYFLFSAWLGQRNLQADTFAWLKTRFKRIRFDPPQQGMKFIYIYALISLLWGGAFMLQYLFINLPIQIQLFWESFLKIWQTAPPLDFADGLAVLTVQLLTLFLLVYGYWQDYRLEQAQKAA